jgi:hypothetical protein
MMVGAHYTMLYLNLIIAVILNFFVVFWPLIKIMHRIGRSGWWSLLILTGHLGIWLLAYTRWPAIEPPSD